MQKSIGAVFKWLSVCRPIVRLSLVSTLGLISLSGHTQVSVSLPNGYSQVNLQQMNVETTFGSVQWAAEWDGFEWRFNRGWESLSAGFLNMAGQRDGPSGCWITADEERPPESVLSGSADARSARYASFNLASSSGVTPLRKSFDYATLCGNSSLSSVSQEGIRRLGAIYIGESGQWIHNNRFYIVRRSIQALPDLSSSAEPTENAIAIAPTTQHDGFRWVDKAGQWIDYNAQGQAVAFADRNDNIIWLQRDSNRRLARVIDANGKVVYTLHYATATSGRLTEVKDYADTTNSQDLVSRSVKYEYDALGRLIKAIDVRGNSWAMAYDSNNRLISFTNPEGHQDRFTYSSSNVKAHIAPDGGQTDYSYDQDDVKRQFLTKVTGPAAQNNPSDRTVMDYTHSRAGELLMVQRNGRTVYEVKYIPTERTRIYKDSRGFETVQVRNEFGQVTQLKQPDGGRTLWEYDPRHLQATRSTDALGIKTKYTYDAKGNLLSIIYAEGLTEQRSTVHTRNAQGYLVSMTHQGAGDPASTNTVDSTWLYEYNTRGQRIKVTDPLGGIHAYGYTRSGLNQRYVDPLGNVSTSQFDLAGNMTSGTNALNQSWNYSYDKLGNLLQTTNPEGKTAVSTFDSVGRLTSQRSGVNGITNWQYDQRGLLRNLTDADGRSIQWAYDRAGRPSEQTDGLGNTTRFNYNLFDGSPASAQDAPADIQFPTYKQQTRFDVVGRPAALTQLNQWQDAAGQQQNQTLNRFLTYDLRGQLIRSIDAAGNTRTFTYNAFGQVLSVTEPSGAQSSMVYDRKGNAIQVKDGKGGITTFEFDALGRVTKETLALGQSRTYQYDAAGNVTQSQDANGNKITASFDALNRVTEAKYYGSDNILQRTVSYTRDASGNVTAWTQTDHLNANRITSASFTYDNANRKLSESVTYPTPAGSPNASYTQSYSYQYSLAGTKTRLTLADGTPIDYGYSAHGQLQSVAIPGEGNLSVGQYNWTAPSQVILPGGTTKQSNYDGLLKLTALQVKTAGQTVAADLKNSYGLRQELESKNIDGSVASYQHDADLRLTSIATSGSQAANANGGIANESFQLDAVANRLGHLINSQNAGPYSYDANHRLIKVGSGDCNNANLGTNPGAGTICYQWDAAGNLTQKTQGTSNAASITRYSYDSQNRLTQISDAQNNPIARYSYDPFNRRLSKEQYRDAQGNALASPKRTIYFYADEGLIAESEQAITVAAGANNTISVSAAQAPEIITQYIPQPNGMFTTGYLAIKTKVIAAGQGNQAGQSIYAYYHHDHLSTPIRATDKAGNTVWSANYNAFGNAQINMAQSSIQSNLRLPGQYHDEESNLRYNWNRYYDQLTGRYVTEDPIGLVGGNNRYIYSLGSPVAYIDPDGRLVWVPVGAVIGGVIGGVVAASSQNANATSVITGIVTGAIGGALPAAGTGYGAVSGLVNYVAENGRSSSASGAFVAVVFGAAGGRLGSAAGNATFATSAAHFIPGDGFRAAAWAQTGNGVVGTLSGQVGNAVSSAFESAVGGIGSTIRGFLCN